MHESARPAAARLLECQGLILLACLFRTSFFCSLLVGRTATSLLTWFALRLQVYEDGEAAAGYTFGKVLGGDETVKTGAFLLLLALRLACLPC